MPPPRSSSHSPPSHARLTASPLPNRSTASAGVSEHCLPLETPFALSNVPSQRPVSMPSFNSTGTHRPDSNDAHRSFAYRHHMTGAASGDAAQQHDAEKHWRSDFVGHGIRGLRPRSRTCLDHPDILQRVTSYLDKPTLLQSQRVSRAFAAAATPHIWHTLTFHNFHGFLGLLEVAKILTRSVPASSSSSSSSTSTAFATNISTGTISSSVLSPPYGQHVRSLQVYYSNAQKGLKSDLALDRPLALVSSQCPNLTSLVLHVHDASKLSSAALQQVLMTVSQSLTSLDLALAPSFLLDPLLHALPPATLAHLQHLTLSNACIGDAGLRVLGMQSHAGLQSVALRVDPDSGPRHLTYEGIVDHLLVPHSHTLQSIELKGIVWPGNHPYALTLPARLRALTRVHISLLAVPSAPTGSEIVGLVRAAAESLQHVCLVGVGGDVIERIAPFMQQVTNLELLHSTALSVQVCQTLARECKKLRQFRVVGSALDDDMMRALAVGKPGNGKAASKAKEHRDPARGCLSQVRDLDLQAVYGVTDNGIRDALPALTRLRWLRLIDCPRISESSVIALCSASPNCETLHLSGAQFTVNVYWLAAPILRQLAWVLLDDSAPGTVSSPTCAPSTMPSASSSSPSSPAATPAAYTLDETDWAELVDTLPRVARAIHHGWILAAQGVATQGKVTNPGAPSTGTSTATVSGSPFGPVLLTPTATAKVAEAAAAAIGSQTRTAGVVIGNMARGGGATRRTEPAAPAGRRFHVPEADLFDQGAGMHESPLSPSVSSPSLSPMPVVITPTCIQAVQRKELFRPVAHPMTIMTPNPRNPYVMQNI